MKPVRSFNIKGKFEKIYIAFDEDDAKNKLAEDMGFARIKHYDVEEVEDVTHKPNVGTGSINDQFEFNKNEGT